MRNTILLHRWLGVIACVAVLMFASSGLLHPVMSWLQPQPAQFMPPRVDMPAQAVSLREVLERHGIANFSAAIAAQLPQGSAYRVQTESGARYFAIADGAEVIDGERQHAEFLARHFLGDSAGEILASQHITRFDSEYVFVNRLLPAWRVDFARDDGIRVYVDTAGNRLATLTDTRKRWMQAYFRALHDFDFIGEQGFFGNGNVIRVALMLVLLTATFATAVFGVVMYVRLKRAAQRLQRLGTRRWHRRLSLAVAVVTFSFTVSGAWHLLQGELDTPVPAAQSIAFQSDTLGKAIPPGAFTLLQVDGVPCFRVSASRTAMQAAAGNEHAHHNHSASTGSAPPEPACLDTAQLQPIETAERRRAEQLARHYAQSASAIDELTQVTRFEGEYGFINKRLPVWKVRFAGDSARWYVETATGALALRADDAAAREGWVFSIFHKARFISDDFKTVRDVFLMVAAFACIVVVLLGMVLFVRGWQRNAIT